MKPNLMLTKTTRLFTRLVTFLFAAISVEACSHGGQSSQIADSASGVAAASSPVLSKQVARRGFLGAFFRPVGPPPYGVFSVYSKSIPPEPYPTPGSRLFGYSGYCDAIAANGQSISNGNLVDKAKLMNIVDLGVKWARMGPSTYFDDTSHIIHHESFGDFDSAQCALLKHNIVPVVTLEAGPVQYNAIDGQFSPHSVPLYKTPSDFAEWCGVVARHEAKIFPSVSRYTLPGNEVNSNAGLFPEGASQVARYSEACYRAVKAIQPKAFLYGLELNVQDGLDPAAYVRNLYDLGCKIDTCYDGLALHLSLHYPIPSLNTPCFPNVGGTYAMRCIDDIQAAAHAPIHVIISETVYVVPGNLPNEATKALAITDEMKAFASNKLIDGVLYANVDECDAYPSGYFVGGCLVDSLGKRLPAFTELSNLAKADY